MTQEQMTQWRKLRELNKRVAEIQMEMEGLANKLADGGRSTVRVDGVQFYLHGLGNMARMVDGAIEAIANDEVWRR